MSTKNDEATALMREAAERKYAALGERHPYSGVCWGLAAVLLREGVRPDETTVAEHRKREDDESKLAWELTSRFHCPLVNFDPFLATVGTIARAIADELYFDFARRPDDTNRRCSFYDVAVRAESCAVFDAYEREVVARLRAQKIRRGSKRHAEFVQQNAERVLGTIRRQVEKGLGERREELRKRVDMYLARELPPIDADLRYIARISVLWEALVRASGADEPGGPNEVRFADLRVLLQARRDRLNLLRHRIETEAKSALGAADGVSVDDLVREGMQRRENLAAFLPKEG